MMHLHPVVDCMRIELERDESGLIQRKQKKKDRKQHDEENEWGKRRYSDEHEIIYKECGDILI